MDRKLKVFVSGSNGFLMTHLVDKLLKEGHSTITMDNLSHPCIYNKRKPDIIDNIRNIWDYADLVADCDILVNAGAWISVEKSFLNPESCVETNFESAMKILNLCNKLKIPMIQSSSSEIYGDKDCDGKMSEKHSTFPKSPYASSKLCIDSMCHAYYHSYGTKVLIVRTFNCFGKFQSNNKFGAVIGIFAERIMNDLPPEIFGDGTAKRDFMSYKDAIDFYYLLITQHKELQLFEKGMIDFNVGSGVNITINELADKMIKLAGKEGKLKPIHVEKRAGEVKEFLCDNQKARSLGWNPDTDFDKLLKEFIDWKKEEKQKEEKK